MLIVALLAGLLYGRALGFGFFNDDPSGILRWLEPRSLSSLFVNAEGFGFYRPLTFALWKLLYALTGANAVAFHGLSLLLHMVNAALLWSLTYQLSRRALYAWGVALAFVTFPFSYESVAYVASLFHLLVSFWILLTLWLYHRGRLTQRPALLWAAGGSMVLAFFSQENWLVVLPLLFLLELLIQRPTSLREFLARPLRYFVLLAPLLLAWWWRVPKSGNEQPQTLNELYQNALIFAQNTVYPVLPLASLDVGDTGLLWVLVAGAVGATLLAARAARHMRLWLLASGWLLVAALPSILFLTPEYLRGSPRLFYLHGMGAALLWAIPLLALGEGLSTTRAGSAPSKLRQPLLWVGGLYVLFLTLPPLPFVRCEMDFYAQTTQLLDALVRQAVDTPAERDLLFANLPFYFTTYPAHPEGCPTTYPFVTTGAIIVPPYASLSDFVRYNGGPARSARGVVVPEYESTWPPRHGDTLPLNQMRDILPQTQLYLFEIEQWEFADLSTMWQPDVPSDATVRAQFGTAVILERYEIMSSTPQQLQITFQWRALERMVDPLSIFVHLYDPAGQLVAQRDGPPTLGEGTAPLVPLTLWYPGDRIVETQVLRLPPDLPPADYRLVVGWYSPSSGERLPVQDADGVDVPEGAYQLQLVSIGSAAGAQGSSGIAVSLPPASTRVTR